MTPFEFAATIEDVGGTEVHIERVSFDGEVKVTDFGLARLYREIR